MTRGQYPRHNIKTRVEQVHALDIRKMNLKQKGMCITIRPDGRQTNYRVADSQLQIETHNQIVQLVSTPCHYGGHRYWFLCHECDKRVAVIYEKNNLYLCRHCHDLPYTSQRVKEADRLRIKARRIRSRLGVSHDLSQPIMFKPKGMHWKTFKHLKLAELTANTQSLVSALKKIKQSG